MAVVTSLMALSSNAPAVASIAPTVRCSRCATFNQRDSGTIQLLPRPRRSCVSSRPVRAFLSTVRMGCGKVAEREGRARVEEPHPLKRRTPKGAPANSRAYLAHPAIWEKNARAAPCSQLRSALLAWSWDEPVPIGFVLCLAEHLLGHATIPLAGRNTYADLSTVGRGVTRSTAVRVPTMLVSTGSRMRC